MTKPVIATGLSGLFISKKPWTQAKKTWFKKAADKLGDASVKEWVDREDYFTGVDDVMRRLYPELSEEDRTVKARESYFDTVLELVKTDGRNEEAINHFTALKDGYALALVTTNTEKATTKILQAAGLDGFFDHVYASKPDEKDDKTAVLERLTQDLQPVLFVGSEREDTQTFCEEHHIPFIAVDFDEGEVAHNMDDLREALSKALSR